MRPSSLNTRHTPTRMALAAAITLALSAAPLVYAQDAAGGAAASVSLDIPAQPLGQALNELARQANLQMTFPAAQVAGRAAPALSGQMTVRQALDRLLAGTGLTAAVDGASVVVGSGASDAGDGSTLPEVSVTAAGVAGGRPLAYLAGSSETGALGDKAILDTPFSIAVVDSQEMFARGARSVGQIFANDAAVYTPTSSFTTDWWGTQVRGLPVRNTYVDDIPMLLYWGGDFPTEITESVTVMKGLAGFMYGFGEPGGALSYRLKRPGGTDETAVSLGYRNPSLLSAQVDADPALGEGLALRANLATERGTAYNANEVERTVASLAVDKRLGASVNWFTTLVYEDSESKAEPLQFYFDEYDAAGSGGRLPRVTYDYDDVNVDNAYYRTKTQLASTGVHWAIDDRWDLKYQLGFARKEHRSNKAFAGLLNSTGDYAGYAYNFAGRLDNLFTQAILQGDVEVGGMRHEIVGGLGFQKSTDRWANEFYFENDFNGNLYEEQTFLTSRTPDFAITPVSYDARQSYVFLSDTVHFDERWQAIVGLRFTDYRLQDLDGDPSVDSGYETRETSPTVALIYKPAADLSLYGSYVEALEPGQLVTPPHANAGEVLDATVSTQYEIGAKHESGDVEYAAALFRVERANLMDELRGTDRFLTQDGRLVYQGLEVSGSYQVSRPLNVGLAAVYLDASIDRVSDDNADIEGNVPMNASKWQFVANAQYRVPGLEGLRLHGNARYFGASYTSDDNTLEVPDRTLVNAGLSYDFKLRGRDLTLAGNVYNLFNTKYWANGGFSAGNLGEARNLALSLQAKF
ncbi:MAG: TonB-dependent receptor [Gemmataceae bacterium]|nr:TonB-dependent receptor [Gemmataceae bacterium]